MRPLETKAIPAATPRSRQSIETGTSANAAAPSDPVAMGDAPRTRALHLLPPAFLALGTFAIGTEGFMIAPLLPTIAADLSMSLSATAMLVVVFTLVLAISSPISTVLTARMRRRDALLLAMVIFTTGNLIAALSSSFSMLMVARIMMAIASGLYIPGANSLAGVIVPATMRGRALAIVSGGMTIAIALGLPLGAIVGHAFGWRATFLAVAAMGFIAIVGILLGVRADAGSRIAVANIAQRIRVVRQVVILRLLGISLFWAIGAFTAYPYIAPYLKSVLDFGSGGISATISMWGIAAAIGISIGGGLNDRFGSDRVVLGSLIALATAFALLAAATQFPASAALPAVLLGVAGWGFSVWSFFPAQMARLIGVGPASEAPIALALNTSTMYLGFSAGSAIGAGIIATGAVWPIGAIAALAEVIAIALDGRRAGLGSDKRP